jgi:tight adherence protein C
MPTITIVAATTVALAIATLGWLVFAPRDHRRAEILANASHGLGAATDAAAGQQPARGGAAVLARRLAPPRVVAKLDRLQALAGRPPAWTLHRILLAKLVLPCVATVLGLLFLRTDPTPGRILLTGVVVIVSHFVPDLLLRSKGQERQAKIALELPDTLDQMTIAVEAGLGFEAAMLRAAKNGTGPFAEELIRTLQEMQFGQSRREAYLALGERTTVVDLRRFLRAVIQADAYGIAVSEVLRTQASEMRLKRRQRAEEKAMKIPVKVIFPLMLCILPALFIVLLGPAALDMMKTFGGI